MPPRHEVQTTGLRSISGLQQLLNDFALFLASPDFRKRFWGYDLHDQLLDSLALWLEYHDGYVKCGTFETLLILVIDAGKEWFRQEMRSDPNPSTPVTLRLGEFTDEFAHENAEDFGKGIHPVLTSREFDLGIARAHDRSSSKR